MIAIKKNAESTNHPWLMTDAGSGFGIGLMYRDLSHVFEVPGVELKTFPSTQDARNFIRDHPEICEEECVLCEMKFSWDNHSLTFVPVEELTDMDFDEC